MCAASPADSGGRLKHPLPDRCTGRRGGRAVRSAGTTERGVGPMNRMKDLLFLGLVLGGGALLAAALLPDPSPRSWTADRPVAAPTTPTPDVAALVDASFRRRWEAEGLATAPKADELAIMRRLSLALTGSIPSLEEIRAFEALPEGDRIAPWLDHLLADRRFADYFAERFARAYVGTEAGPFLVYRRRRFVSWLSDQLQEGRPYDAIVRDLIADDGLWTDRPATNFVTVAYDPEVELPDANRLAARTARAFLGVRIDCAQCHDHPFEDWKQADFQGLAAFYGQARSGLTGIHDDPEAAFEALDHESGEERAVEPEVPFLPELLPAEGDRRQRLAGWVTAPANPSLARATVNRVWALMFGRPLVEPVDDLEAVEVPPEPLTLLADDLVAHGYDLRRLVRAITATEVFGLDSAADPEPSWDQEAAWAVFPLVRLRPEQVAGSVLQAGSLAAIDRDSPLFVRFLTGINEGKFVDRYGDTGEDEFAEGCSTIPQRLLMMNGEVVREATKPGLFAAASRVASQAPTDRAAVEAAYLAVLTRRPTPEEADHFAAAIAGKKGDARAGRLSDLYWTLLNASEFSWNH